MQQPSRASGRSGPAACSASGLGASRQKWGWVPNDTTDFIFAILGEELGLVGTLCVVAALRRPGVRRAADRPPGAGHLRPPRARLSATAWIVGQALVNIGAVLGLLPITGVPLPLVSSGPVVAARDDGGARHADVVRQTRARGAEALAAADPGAARRVLSWLGLDRRRE